MPVMKEGIFMLKRFAVVIGLSVMTGCAGMSKDECLYADWRAIGYEDGAAGQPVSAVSERRSTCARKAGVTVDMAEYTAGRAQGLDLYCQPSRAFAIGADGQRYHGVCAGPGEAAFTAAYQAGRQLFDLERQVAEIEDDIRQARADLRNVEQYITDAEAGLIAPETTVEDRVQLVADLKTYSEDKGNIETAIVALNRDQVRAERELREYRDYLAASGQY